MQTGFCLKTSNRCNLFVVSRLCPDIFCFAFLSLSFFILCANDLLKLSLSLESGWLTMAMVAGVGLRVLRHILQRSWPHLHSGPAHTEALRKGEWSALSGKINKSNSDFFLGEAGSFGLIAGPLTWTDFKEANVFLHIERSICVENGESERQW